MGRAPCCDKANVKKGPWSPEEDAKLKSYIEKYGTGGNWIALPQKIGLKRCGKSCRLRWLNYLRPNIKHGGFSEEEDNIILSLYISIGSRWSIIAAQLPGRTDNDIKNYWNTRLKKKLLGRRKQQQQLAGMGDSKEEVPSLSSSALERLQLHLQLQNQQPLQSSFSTFFNNPAFWPKLHPLIQEKLIQNNFLPLNNQVDPYAFINNNNNSNNNNSNSANFFQQSAALLQDNNDNHQIELQSPSLNGSASSESSNGVNTNNDDNNIGNMGDLTAGGVLKSEGYMGMERVSSFQAELNHILSNDNKVINQDQMGVNEFDEGMSGWWSNESNSTTCWDASTVLQSESVLYQDYA